MIDAFMSRHGGREGSRGARGAAPLIFLATDDSNYQAAVVHRYGAQRVVQVRRRGEFESKDGNNQLEPKDGKCPNSNPKMANDPDSIPKMANDPDSIPKMANDPDSIPKMANDPDSSPEMAIAPSH